MLFDKFQNINNGLETLLKDSDLNYARLILPERKGEVSIVGKYSPAFLGEKFITLNGSLEIVESDDFSDFYYGVSPKLDSSLIVEYISNLKLVNEQELKAFVAQYSSLFMLHKGQEQYILPLSKYIVLCFSYNYGLVIHFANQSKAVAVLNKAGGRGSFLKQVDSSLIIHGCPTETLLAVLCEYKYVVKDGIVTAVEADEGVSIYDVYRNKENISLLNGDVFYSGVLPRTLCIDEREDWHSNKDVTSIVLHYERSTYATVFALDNNFTDHPLMINDKAEIFSFFYYDDHCKRKYLTGSLADGSIGRKNLILQVNRYLFHSFNVNQIGVTGNIISSDGLLLCGKRNEKAIDSSKIYPGVNGNAEIADKNVELYNDSVDVDYPTLHIEQSKNGFGLELCRESEAELNLALSNNLLKCYGMVISGIIPNEPIDSKIYPPHRRLHFNILFKQKVKEDFKTIRKLQCIATERYESSDLYGLSVKTYKGVFDFVKKTIERSIRWILNWRLAITNIFTIALFALSLNTIGFSLEDWRTRISFLFAVLVVSITVVDIVKNAKEKKKQKKHEHHIAIIKDKSTDIKIDAALDKFFKNATYHPVAYIALKLHLIESVYKGKE